MKKTFSLREFVKDSLALDWSAKVVVSDRHNHFEIEVVHTLSCDFECEPLKVLVHFDSELVYGGVKSNGDPFMVVDLSTRKVIGMEVANYYDFQVSNLEVTPESITAVVDFGEGQPRPVKVSVSTTPDEVTVALEAL